MARTTAACALTFLVLSVNAIAAIAPAWGDGGDLDTSFSRDGISRADFSKKLSVLDVANGIALQEDGRIVLAGQGGYPSHFAVARFTAGGSLDDTFSGNGKVQTDFSSDTEWANDVVEQPNHRILAAGVARGDQEKFALARYRADGSPDTDFSGDGRLRTGFGSGVDASAEAVALQEDRKIVVVGSAGGSALARYNPDGTLDPSFGVEGKVTTEGGPAWSDVAILDDGSIVTAGAVGSAMAAGRYRSDGSPDATFGIDGIVTTDFGTDYAYASGIAVASDGKLVLAGTAGGDDGSDSAESDFAVARFLSDGTLDPSFDGDGRVTTDFGGPTGLEWGSAVAIQPDGRIVVVGTALPEVGPCSSGYQIALARYVGSGALDPSFGSGGMVLSVSDEGHDVAIQADGKIVVGGWTGEYCGDPKFVVVRFLAT